MNYFESLLSIFRILCKIILRKSLIILLLKATVFKNSNKTFQLQVWIVISDSKFCASSFKKRNMDYREGLKLKNISIRA